METKDVTHIIIHHSLTKDQKKVDWDAITRYHMSYAYNGNIITREEALELKKQGLQVKNPYKYNGYHRGIELVGNTYEVKEGRALNVPGAHCRAKNMNRCSWGVCVVGNFDIAPPPVEQWHLTIKAVSELMYLNPNIKTEHVRGHNEFDKFKSCPGKYFNMGKFREDLHIYQLEALNYYM